MKNEGSLATIERSRAVVAGSVSDSTLGTVQIQARVNIIQGAIKGIFKQDVHYGIIPGTKKPTLYKAGAEQLLVMFRVSPSEPKVEDLSTADVARYRVTRSGVSHEGQFLGAGVGECSSEEEKYKWRRPVCDGEFEDTPVDRRREVWKSSFGKTQKIKQVRVNHADVANTILKMADKRAMIAMTLAVTGASDAFTQDVEDLPREYVNQYEPRPQVEAPQRKSEAVTVEAQTTPTPEVANAGTEEQTHEEMKETVPTERLISEKQMKRLFAITKASGKTYDAVKSYLEKMGIKSSKEIPVSKYEEVCGWVQSNTDTGELNEWPVSEEEPPL